MKKQIRKNIFARQALLSRLVYLFTAFFLLVSNTTCATIENDLSLRISPNDKRYPTFLLALQLMQERNVETIVETGTARNGVSACGGDGCSTSIFATWARKNKAALYSVDIDPKAIAKAKSVTRKNPNVKFFIEDSVTFLSRFDKTIDFLYLDSFDFDSNNPLPSQIHHLNEIIAAYPHLSDNTIIMIDDCDLPHGGKGKLVIEYLLEKGWQILLAKYQTILIKNPYVVDLKTYEQRMYIHLPLET